MELQLIREEDGYSIYENPNKEMVEQIKNLPKPTTFRHYRHGSGCVLESTLENGNLVCKATDGDIFTLYQEEYDEYTTDAHLDNINRIFNVGELFQEHFLPIYNGGEILYEMSLRWSHNPYRDVQETWSTGVNPIFFEEQYSFWDGQREIQFEYHNGASNGHCYLDADGNIKNRNYNRNFNELRPYETKEEVVNNFLDLFNTNGWVKRQGDVFFTEKMAYKTYNDEDGFRALEVYKLPLVREGVYYQPGASAYGAKMNKSAQDSSLEELREFMRNQLPEAMLTEETIPAPNFKMEEES